MKQKQGFLSLLMVDTLAKIKWYLFASYFMLLLYVAFFLPRRQELVWDAALINIMPVKNTWYWYHSLDHRSLKQWLEFLENLVGNIVLFIPFPFALKYCIGLNRTRALFLGILTSFLLELLQFGFEIGVPDVDDMILNTTGVLLGNYFLKRWLLYRSGNL